MKRGSKGDALSRRNFLRMAAAFTAVSSGTLGASPARRETSGRASLRRRAERHLRRACQIRLEAAQEQRGRGIPQQSNNGDENRYPNKIASFTKTLPHNKLGEVDAPAYQALVDALDSEDLGRLAKLELAGSTRLANPQASYAFSLEGLDPVQTFVAPPPSFASAEIAGEAAELYWQALTRDVPFNEYDTDSLIARASNELSRLTDFRGPKHHGKVTPATLFRGPTASDLVGPYISQFLWKEIVFGPIQLFQKIRTYFADHDYLVTYDEWLNIQNGAAGRKPQLGTHRYVRNGRDLSAYVQTDFSYQAFVNAALILFSMQGTTDATKSYRGAPYDAGNPYRGIRNQSTFVTFGQAHALDLVARVTSAALKACWYHKWLIHRRMRPEEFGGRVHNHKTGAAEYPIHDDLLRSEALEATHGKHGTYLLPQAYPEGCPTHPAYPAGHAAIAGACVTVLKAYFDESFPIDDPVVASADGLTLTPYRGPELTVGGELNKLAGNVAIGRDTAGVHWRSDGIEGLKLGEEVAISVLRDQRRCYPETFAGWSLTRFDGSRIVV